MNGLPRPKTVSLSNGAKAVVWKLLNQNTSSLGNPGMGEEWGRDGDEETAWSNEINSPTVDIRPFANVHFDQTCRPFERCLPQVERMCSLPAWRLRIIKSTLFSYGRVREVVGGKRRKNESPGTGKNVKSRKVGWRGGSNRKWVLKAKRVWKRFSMGLLAPCIAMVTPLSSFFFPDSPKLWGRMYVSLDFFLPPFHTSCSPN